MRGTYAVRFGRLHGLAVLPALLVILAACTSTPGAGGASEARTALYFESVADRPPLRTAFLRRMPKGGDLHNHLSGTIYAENYLRWAAEDGLCIRRDTLALAPPPCDPAAGRPPASVAYSDTALYSALIDSLSMRNYALGHRSGHDQFFDTFFKFDATRPERGGDMLAEAISRLAAQNTHYIELMQSPGMSSARRLGAAAGWDTEFARLRRKLLDAGIANAVAEARRAYDAQEARMRERLRCGTSDADPGCAVTVRYIAQVIRTFPREQVFAQVLLAVELIRADPRVVGLNLVAPEDHPTTLREYTDQMRAIGFLTDRGTATNVTLHAGELTLGLVPPEDLRFHIRQAVEIAGARRIGHGVAIGYEDDALGLLAEMARRGVLVEINLTSNEQILGVRGADHPFMTYRRAGVPVALSTDDEGVSRGDLTHEYQRAAATYDLGYRDLKQLARNGLEHAFLAGASLWRGRGDFVPVAACAAGTPGDAAPSPACRDFLGGSDKAREQWRLEAAFAAFEATPWPVPETRR
ncbi:MAG: adenosine deaminase [Rhodospirillales bacterium]|nr:adenosine deaminase [Rhodospirillales bacterium]